jgi:hypothetical protein
LVADLDLVVLVAGQIYAAYHLVVLVASQIYGVGHGHLLRTLAG